MYYQITNGRELKLVAINKLDKRKGELLAYYLNDMLLQHGCKLNDMSFMYDHGSGRIYTHSDTGDLSALGSAQQVLNAVSPSGYAPKLNEVQTWVKRPQVNDLYDHFRRSNPDRVVAFLNERFAAKGCSAEALLNDNGSITFELGKHVDEVRDNVKAVNKVLSDFTDVRIPDAGRKTLAPWQHHDAYPEFTLSAHDVKQIAEDKHTFSKKTGAVTGIKPKKGTVARIAAFAVGGALIGGPVGAVAAVGGFMCYKAVDKMRKRNRVHNAEEQGDAALVSEYKENEKSELRGHGRSVPVREAPTLDADSHSRHQDQGRSRSSSASHSSGSTWVDSLSAAADVASYLAR